MTLFDLLFLVVMFRGLLILTFAVTAAVRGRRARALALLRGLAVGAVAYVGIVYLATAFSKQVILQVGDPQCSDDWCIAVDRVQKTPQGAVAIYEITLRIFSRARRVAQRELVARDVYLVDSQWRRYDPTLGGTEAPLNTLLQPGESVTASRRFEVPASAHNIGLMVDRTSILPFCVIVGECEAFHKGALVRLGEESQ